MQPVASSEMGTSNNTCKVRKEDFDAFEALAIDGRMVAKKSEFFRGSNSYSGNYSNYINSHHPFVVLS